MSVEIGLTVSDLRNKSYASAATFKNKVAKTYGFKTIGDGGVMEWVFDATSKEKDDSVTVIKPKQLSEASAGRWKAVLNQVNLLNFGVDLTGKTNSTLALRTALDVCKKYDLPMAGFNGLVNFDGNITIDFPWHFYGLPNGKSKFYCKPQTTAFKSTFASSFSTIKNLYLYSDNLYVPEEKNNDEAHGWIIDGIQYWEHVVIEMFAGSGTYGNAYIAYNEDWSVKHIGNLSGSRFVNCEWRMNRIHGCEIKGPEANKITFDNCYVTGNGASGFNDNGFLGNEYRGCMAHSNNSPEIHWHRGLCKHNGKVWAAFKTGKLKAPNNNPVNSTGEGEWIEMTPYWQGTYQFLLDHANIKPYDANKKYYAGGAFNLGSDSFPAAVALHLILGCYSECDNTPSYWLPSSISVGGDHGAGIYKSAHINGFWGMAHSNGFISYGADQKFTYLNKDGVTTHKPTASIMKTAPEVNTVLEFHGKQDKDYAEYHKRKIQERKK